MISEEGLPELGDQLTEIQKQIYKQTETQKLNKQTKRRKQRQRYNIPEEGLPALGDQLRKVRGAGLFHLVVHSSIVTKLPIQAV